MVAEHRHHGTTRELPATEKPPAVPHVPHEVSVSATVASSGADAIE
jgi:hypothetical protein